MSSRIGSREGHVLAGLTPVWRMRLPAPLRLVLRAAAPSLLCGFFFVGGATAQNMPPEVNAPVVRSTRPKPAPVISPSAPLVTKPSLDSSLPPTTNTGPAEQPPTSPASPKSHRRGMPPNVVHPQAEPTPAAPAEPTSLLQQPAGRAEVEVSHTGIAIQANNSSLSQVLHDISSATGMKVEGLGHDERIFGNYGPGAPRDVLSSLLVGSGYNVLMVGEIADGAPRHLILSQRNSGTAPPAAVAADKPPDEEAEPDQVDQGDQDIEPPTTGQPSPPGTQSPNAPPGSEVRTPQQLLEQLQRMHQDQPQSEQPPPE